MAERLKAAVLKTVVPLDDKEAGTLLFSEIINQIILLVLKIFLPDSTCSYLEHLLERGYSEGIKVSTLAY